MTKVTFRNAEATVSVTLTTEQCCQCGVVFAMDEDFQQHRLRDKQWFYCPAGHSQHYLGESDAAKLKRAEQLLAAANTQAAGLERVLGAERRSHAATKGQLTKTLKRVQNGVCPECNRQFPNLRDHMATKHGEEA